MIKRKRTMSKQNPNLTKINAHLNQCQKQNWYTWCAKTSNILCHKNNAEGHWRIIVTKIKKTHPIDIKPILSPIQC